MQKAAISNALLTEGRAYAQEILKGLTAGTSHFHAVKYMKDKLAAAGFNEIQEQDKWSLTPGQSYFLTRNQSCVIAFTLGTQTAEGIDFFKAIGCHTDSPVLKLAPHSKVDNKLGYQ
jgi:aspartyl aminopeptidase